MEQAPKVKVKVRDPYVFALAAAARADGQPIDVAAANTESIAHLKPRSRVVIVPGFTPVDTEVPVQLHAITAARLKRSVNLLHAGEADSIVVSGGNVHPEHTRFNEAWEMRRQLLGHHSLRPEQVVLEPFARHSTTNLRNAGRILRARGIPSAVIVTDAGQGFYYGAPLLSTFTLRCIVELGYSVGELHSAGLDFTHVTFTPSKAVWTQGKDRLDP